MAEVHKLLEQHGKAEALKLGIDRKVIEAASSYMAAEDGEIGYLYSGWAQSALPHKRLADDASWQVHTDYASLVVQPGLRPSLTGDAVSVGVPYGSRARLICLYLQSEALKNNSPEVELGKTLHAWLKRLDISIGGKSMAAVRDQAERISRCRMSFQIRHGNKVGLINQSMLETAMFIDDEESQGKLFIETARLSDRFFEQLQKHPVPLDENAIKTIANNSMAIDVYCWLSYRLHALSGPIQITWKALHGQFGRGSPLIAQFKYYFKQTLDLAMAVYPEAKVTHDQAGVTLYPSRPPISPKVISMATKRLKG
jgi:Plasmid encoded RepA protein